MGSSTQVPNYVQPNLLRDMKEGTDFALGQMQQGLSPIQRAIIEGSSAGALRSGIQSLQEQIASQGNVPIGASLGALTNMRSQSSRNLMETLFNANQQAKQTGVGNILSTLGLGLQGANSQNTYNMEQYKVDKENEFNLGKVLGGLMGAGGQLGSAAISKGAK